MILTDRHLEMIRETVREVDFGSVTINISATSNKLDLSINRRVREDDEPEGKNSRPPLIARHNK